VSSVSEVRIGPPDMHWEKYFMLLLPLVGILVLAMGADPVDGPDIDRAG
jgi:hypothetical protein